MYIFPILWPIQRSFLFKSVLLCICDKSQTRKKIFNDKQTWLELMLKLCLLASPLPTWQRYVHFLREQYPLSQLQACSRSMSSLYNYVVLCSKTPFKCSVAEHSKIAKATQCHQCEPGSSLLRKLCLCLWLANRGYLKRCCYPEAPIDSCFMCV